jgi:hypothetical protein
MLYWLMVTICDQKFQELPPHRFGIALYLFIPEPADTTPATLLDKTGAKCVLLPSQFATMGRSINFDDHLKRLKVEVDKETEFWRDANEFLPLIPQQMTHRWSLAFQSSDYSTEFPLCRRVGLCERMSFL